ncbi:thioredoxin [bacterium]|nr:MAG: thioredoxin [bacterium]
MKNWTLDSFIQYLNENEYVITFFEGKDCRVCHALLPKMEELVNKEYSNTPMIVVNTDENPDIAGQNIIFSLPVILVFKQGREVARISGKNPMYEINEQLKRTLNYSEDDNPYSSLFENLAD